MNRSINNTNDENPEYRISRSKKVRIIKILISLIPVLVSFVYSRYSGLKLDSNGWEGVISAWFFVLLFISIYVIIRNLQSRRLVINKDGIYHIRPKNRFFLPWHKVVSVEYNWVNGRFPEDTVTVCVYEGQKRIKYRADKVKAYTFNLLDFYAIKEELIWDERHFWFMNMKPNIYFNKCMKYYCKKNGIRYNFKKNYVKQIQS